MTPETFAEKTQGLRQLILKRDERLSSESGRHWSEISVRTYDFGRTERIAAIVGDKLALADLLGLYDRYLARDAPERRKIAAWAHRGNWNRNEDGRIGNNDNENGKINYNANGNRDKKGTGNDNVNGTGNVGANGDRNDNGDGNGNGNGEGIRSGNDDGNGNGKDNGTDTRTEDADNNDNGDDHGIQVSAVVDGKGAIVGGGGGSDGIEIDTKKNATEGSESGSGLGSEPGSGLGLGKKNKEVGELMGSHVPSCTALAPAFESASNGYEHTTGPDSDTGITKNKVGVAKTENSDGSGVGGGEPVTDWDADGDKATRIDSATSVGEVVEPEARREAHGTCDRGRGGRKGRKVRNKRAVVVIEDFDQFRRSMPLFPVLVSPKLDVVVAEEQP